MSPRHSNYIPSSLKSPLTCVNYNLFITFQQDDGYLNEPIKIYEQIKLANQLIQRRTHDRNGKDNSSLKAKNKWVVQSIEIKKEEENVLF